MALKIKKSKVLIVDDDIVTAELIREFINDLENIEIDLAYSGQEAIELANDHSYSLFLLDVQMPNINGFDLLTELRKFQKHELTPALFISAYFAEQENIIQGLETTAIDFIAKPVNSDILRAKVKQFIRLDQYQREREQLLSKYEDSTRRAQENENRFRKISYTANDAILVLDEHFNIIFWNRASKKMFGYSKIEIRDENIFEHIISERDKEKLKKKLSEILNTHSDILHKTEEIIAVSKLGYEIQTEMSFSSFKTAKNNHNIVVVARDISMRKKLEKNMLRAKELREANKTMKEFIDNVSHELRTPMNAIIGISKMLTKYNTDNLQPKQLEGLNIISNNGEKLLELINDILDLSKLDSGKIQLNEEEFSLDKLLSNIRSIVVNLIDKKNIKFFIKKSPSVPEFIYTDQKKLTQILLNLLGNSVKFTESGKIVLSLHLKENSLFFEVFDTGCGIPESNLGIIFNRFRQVDNSNSKSHQGTGLGLHIVKKMAELFNGEIRVDSILGKSTTFTLVITLSKLICSDGTNSETNEKVPEKPLDDPSIFSNPQNLLALLVEDNQSNRIVYKNCLEHLGFNVILSDDGTSGYHKLEKFHPDLVLLNLEIQKYSAYSILKNVLQTPQLSNSRVIAISGTTQSINPETLNSNSRFLAEPVSEKDLVNVIREIKPTRSEEETDIIVFEDINIKTKLKIKEISKPYEFINEDINESFFMIRRRRCHFIVLNGFSKHSANFNLLEKINEKFAHQFNKPNILVVSHGNHYFDHLISDFKHIAMTKIEELGKEITVEELKKYIKKHVHE